MTSFSSLKDILLMFKRSILFKLLKDPLSHFLFIGIGLFFFYAQLNSDQESDNRQQIVMKKSKIEVLSNTFSMDNRRIPTDKELQELLENDLREEVLSREAIAVGLDKDDLIIRHRLAQKMQYLFEDVAMIDDPSDEVLKAYFPKSQLFLKNAENSKELEFSNFKHQLKSEWIAKEQQKENDIFYENLKKRYDIIMDDEVDKALNVSVLK